MKKFNGMIFICSMVIFSLTARRHVFRDRSPRTVSIEPQKEVPIVIFRRKLPRKIQPYSTRKRYTKKYPQSIKKNIVIFSSTGGGGHSSVSAGLCAYLGDTYDITVLNALKTVHAPVDTLGTLTFGKVCGEDLYNFFLRCGWTNLIRQYVSAGTSYMTMRHSTLVKLTMDYFKDEKPDLVISVIPMLNAALLEACEKLDIPFLILTNDLNSTNYINGLRPPYYKKFRYTLPFDDPGLWQKIESAKIPKDQVLVSGFPLRPEFFTPKNVPKLKRKFNVPIGKPVVMVFMGGAGSQASYRYVRKLARLDMPMHIIVCLGRNERLRRNLHKIMLPEGVTLSIFGFTRRIADLMAISDVLITKPGPNSLCEGLCSQVPMILDMTHGTIWWEQLNIDFMVKYSFAEQLFDYNCLSQILPKYFKDSSFTDDIKKKMSAFKCVRFDKKIGPLVDQMIGMS